MYAHRYGGSAAGAALAAALVTASCLLTGCGGGASQASATQRDAASQQLAMEKYVSPSATFVLYKPVTWTVSEAAEAGYVRFAVTDPRGAYESAMAFGRSPAGGDLLATARFFLTPIGEQFPDLTLTKALRSPDNGRVLVEGAFTDPAKGRREFRCWVTAGAGEFTVTRILAPAGELERMRPTLLTILSNVRVLKIPASPAAPTEPLVTHRLRDGSASFQVPRNWTVQEIGAGAFAANDPAGSPSFIVATVQILNPNLGVNVPGAISAPYMAPHRALEFLASSQRLASNFQFLQVTPRTDIFPVQPGGPPVTAEEFVYTFDAGGKRGKGYSFGVSFGSRTGVEWRFWHLTVGAPIERFDALVPTFFTMLQSYRIDDAYARAYVARGMQNLRRMQQETSRIVSRNAEEIRSMMQAAYDERQASADYIDYQRTNYIRGEQDWISQAEGGTVYHTDRWGTKNTVTGESWKGAPYDYVNFEGANPKYTEQMTPIDTRLLWERHVR